MFEIMTKFDKRILKQHGMKNFIFFLSSLLVFEGVYANQKPIANPEITSCFHLNEALSNRDNFEHDLKLEYRAVHFMGENGFMYTTIPSNSQYYLNFSAKIRNTGMNVELAQLQVQSSDGVFSALSEVIELQPDESAIFSIDGQDIWIDNAWGATLSFTALSNNVLDNTIDDELSFQYSKSPADIRYMSADFFNDQINSLTGEFTGNFLEGDEQGIGILYERLGFHPFDVSHVQVGIAAIPENQQNLYIGNAVYAKVWKYDVQGFTLLGQTESKTLTAQDFGNTIWLEAVNSCISIPSEGVIFVAACFDAANRVPIALAGESLYQQVVAFNDHEFYWTEPIVETNNTMTMSPVVRPYFSCPLGVSDNNTLFQSTIYPNPTTKNTTITLDVIQSDDFSLTVHDLSGKTMKVWNLLSTYGKQNIIVDIQDLAAGVYMLRISNGVNSTEHKLVVE